jgi:hypothetical protein
MSIALAEGVIPYRDVFLHKTPAALFVGAAGGAIAALFGGTPLAGAHLAFLALGAAGPALLYMLCRPRFGTGLALAASAFMLSFDPWVVSSVEGVSPKVLTTCLGLSCLLAAQHGRWLTAGIFGGAATLAWQPGVAFLLGAAWCMRSAQSLRGWLSLCTGAAIVPTGLLGWLAAVGALDDFWWQAVVFNLHYIQLHARGPWGTITHVLNRLSAWAPLETALAFLALPGLRMSPALVPSGLAAFGLIYGVMLFVSFQAWPDTILIAPVLGAVLASGLAGICTRLMRERWATALVAAVSLCIAPIATNPRLRPPLDFRSQGEFMHRLEASIGPDERVLVVSLPEFLIHTGRRSVWKWPYMWFGVDRFAAAHTDGGFDALLGALDAEPPALILIARRWQGPLRDRFDEWAATRYTRSKLRIYAHTARPIEVYHRRSGSDFRSINVPASEGVFQPARGGEYRYLVLSKVRKSRTQRLS